ncbi:hypothetical protein OCAE111667_16505 [Occultella aeris]|uniref:Uncharacterized protein n=1 Tax=Occultella aeris TaxID=2761496 RepID=A0A7M4DKR8_9MICO|nr:hypothetical protein [Occultella aeris]VZO37760.1 hypothetical protein HALOF300_02732 [Occultella aeris]
MPSEGPSAPATSRFKRTDWIGSEADVRNDRNATTGDVAIAAVMVLALLAVTAILLRGDDGTLRWFAVPTGLGAAGLLVWAAGTARSSARARWSVRVDGVAEQMAQVATWCGRLGGHLEQPRSAEITRATKVRVAQAITQGEAALAAWSAAPVRRRTVGRLQSVAARLLPEMEAADLRASHERTIATHGRIA